MRVPTLATDDVHVWRLELDAPRAHVALRELLGAYLRCDPCGLSIVARKGGKPRLAPGSGQEWLRFNLSHSCRLALVAVACEREVGVDVERISHERRIDTIAEQLFAPGENARLRALPQSQRVEAFYRQWARKEAYLKATGEGLGGLEQLDLCRPLEGYALYDVDVGPGHAGALAVEGAAASIRLLRGTEADLSVHSAVDDHTTVCWS